MPVTSFLGALDHDVNQKGSLTPLVTLVSKVPEDISESFYTGQVTVCMKDSVFQASNSVRSVLEMLQSLRQTNSEEKLQSVKTLFMITDGGLEHRVNFDSVKFPLILLFQEMKLDMLVAIRIAPGHSYVNIVERIMSILNIGFKNVALCRDELPMDDTIQKV